VTPPPPFSFFPIILLIKRKLKGNFLFLWVLTAKIDEGGNLTAIESSGVQNVRFQSLRGILNRVVIQGSKVKFFQKITTCNKTNLCIIGLMREC
jgi:hypothetical protein